MLDHFSLAHYLELLEWTSRLARDGKQRLSDKVPPLLERLGKTSTRCRPPSEKCSPGSADRAWCFRFHAPASKKSRLIMAATMWLISTAARPKWQIGPFDAQPATF